MPKTDIKVDYTHSSLADIDLAIKVGKLSVDDAQAILEKRAKRDSKSGKRAASWLVRNGFATKTAVKPARTTRTNKPKANTKRAKVARGESDEALKALKKEVWALGAVHADEITDGERGTGSGWRTVCSTYCREAYAWFNACAAAPAPARRARKARA